MKVRISCSSRLNTPSRACREFSLWKNLVNACISARSPGARAVVMFERRLGGGVGVLMADTNALNEVDSCECNAPDPGPDPDAAAVVDEGWVVRPCTGAYG